MPLKLYYDLMSQPSRALYIFLNVTGISFESKPIKLREGEHFGDAFGEINPFRKVPVIDDDGFKLTESVAILRYLAREKGVDDHWYPNDSKLQAKVDEYLEWQHVNTRLFCAMFFQHKFLRPMMFQKPVNEKSVKTFQDGMENCLREIEQIWLKDGKNKFICGDDITIADLLACCELEQPGLFLKFKVYLYTAYVKYYYQKVWLGMMCLQNIQSLVSIEKEFEVPLEHIMKLLIK